MAQRDLIYQRPGGTWVLKLQYSDPWLVSQYGKKREISLTTKDKKEALLSATPHMEEHRKRLWEAENRRRLHCKVTGPEMVYPLGETVLEDGTRVFASTEKAVFLKDGVVVKEEKNTLYHLTFRFDPKTPKAECAPGAVPKALDENLFNDWVEERKPNKHIKREAERAWAIWRALMGNKAMAKCGRPDGKAFVKKLQTLFAKSATVNKHLSHMSSIANIAIGNGHLENNPFAKCALKVDDQEDRDPFSEEQMALILANLHTFDPDEAKLWILLASTGMRRGEAWDITCEWDELGIRKVRVGTKNDQSDRFIPLPDAFLQRYPEKITGPLFEASPVNLGKRLLRRIRALGINSPKLVLHSTRHRAKDRLRAHGCPEDVQEWICGHEKVTAADGYGKGPPMSILKPWINKIGV